MNGNETVKQEIASGNGSLNSPATNSTIQAMQAEERDGNGNGTSGLDRNCMHDRIRWTILERVMDGVYQPGERLKELTLAREFHVSQAPVREALRKLEAIGVLKSDPYRGTRVRELSTTELRDA